MQKKQFIAIDLKSFYASVECRERGLDPLDACLLVADVSRTEKTICLAVSPALKSFGIGGRARLFEALQRLREVNADRKMAAGPAGLTGKSTSGKALSEDPTLAVDYIAAPPRMKLYMDYSTRIYDIYLRYIAPEDMHIYSVDEVFLDVTPYLATYGKSAHELARIMIGDVLAETGITATAGIGTNLYLAKIAMDIVAKHIPADEDGVRIAELDEISYRKNLWGHEPITDFWRVGPGTARTLEKYGMATMGDVARCSLGGPQDYWNGELLYKLFGINAELLIDHAWGVESCTMADIKKYRPENNSFSSGQVLQRPYTPGEARVVLLEMADAESLKLVEKRLVTDQLVLDIGYDIENLKDEAHRKAFQGEVTLDWYGRSVPKRAHGSKNLSGHTSSTKEIVAAAGELFDEIADTSLLIRRLNITVNHVITEREARRRMEEKAAFRQMSFLDLLEEQEEKPGSAAEEGEEERNLQEAMIAIRKKYGRNAVLRGLSFREGATMRERNGQIGGHKA